MILEVAADEWGERGVAGYQAVSPNSRPRSASSVNAVFRSGGAAELPYCYVALSPDLR